MGKASKLVDVADRRWWWAWSRFIPQKLGSGPFSMQAQTHFGSKFATFTFSSLSLCRVHKFMRSFVLLVIFGISYLLRYPCHPSCKS